MNFIFEKAYEEHYAKIYNYVFYRLLNHADAEDIVGEVFLKALENADRFEGRNNAAVSTWLFSIARNAVNDHFRKAKKVVLSLVEEQFDSVSDKSDNISEWEDLHYMHELLKVLDDRSREVLALRYWGDMSYAEIAAKVGLTDKHVSMILSRAVARLRKEIK